MIPLWKTGGNSWGVADQAANRAINLPNLDLLNAGESDHSVGFS